MRWTTGSPMGLVVVAALAASCTGDVSEDGPPSIEAQGSVSTSPGAWLPAWVRPSPALAIAADPKLEGFEGWPLVFDADAGRHTGARCVVRVLRGGARLVALDGSLAGGTCSATWDGRDDAGAWVAPGPLTARAEITDGTEVVASAQAPIEVLRIGIAEVSLDPVEASGEVSLLFAAVGGVRRSFWETDPSSPSWRIGPDATEGAGAVRLELSDGTPRALPAVWDDLETPPMDGTSPDGVEDDSYNLPTAWIAGTTIDARVTLSGDVAGDPDGSSPQTVDVRVVPPDGLTLTAGDAFEHGAILVARTGASPVPAVGKYDVEWRWTFEARAPGGDWTPIPGGIVTRHRLYGLASTPIFSGTDLPHRAWVEVVDTVAGWVGGETRDPIAVASRIVEGVYYDMGLRYDVESGASAYTSYPVGWNDARFGLSWFQERDYGNVINCSDAASIVSTYANMMGVDFRYHILQHRFDGGFDLNYIQAIGTPSFTETPFTGGRGAFRYHAVVGPADGTLFDATLALDGDGTPTAPPHTLLLAQGMPPNEYLFALSSEWMQVAVSIDDKVVLR